MSVEGVVVDAETGVGIENAIVELGDRGTILSAEAGRFRFTGVPTGTYSVTVDAFGYALLEVEVSVVESMTLTLALQPAPLRMDSILVELSTVDFDGRARDSVLDANLYDARVRSNQGHDERTSWHGRFDLDDVFEQVPLRIVISSLGYMPLDSTFVPDHEARYDFNLTPDPVAGRIIGIQIQRLVDRTESGRRYRPYRYGASMNRQDMARFMSQGSLQTMLEATYPRHVLRRVTCFLLDEQATYSRAERTHVLETTLPQELERLEFLEFPGQRGALMLRVYTRRFIQRLMATGQDLRRPVMITAARTCR